MKISHRQKLRGLLLKPLGFGQGLALGAVAVTAGVIGRVLKAASVALLEMPSQLLGATDLNGPHHLEMGGWQTMRTAVALPVQTKDIGQLGARLFFSCCPPMFERQQRRRRLAVRESQKVQRTPRRDKLGLPDLEIALGTLQRVMTQKSLNGHQVHPAFQKMRSKAMAQYVDAAAFLNFRFLFGQIVDSLGVINGNRTALGIGKRYIGERCSFQYLRSSESSRSDKIV